MLQLNFKPMKQSVKLFRILLFLLFVIIAESAWSITTTWIAARPGAGADNTSSWYDAANWDNGLPDATKDVIIPSGTNTCYIPTSPPTMIPPLSVASANSITIQNDAALLNESSSSVNIVEDFIIQSGGYYFCNTTRQEVSRDFIIQSGGYFIIDGQNELTIGRNFENQGAMGRLQITNTILAVTFTGSDDATITASNGNNRTVNILSIHDPTGTAFDYLIPAVGTVTAIGEILITGAFDNVIINKEAKTNGNVTTIQNIGMPFMAGVVGDGVNDFDGNSTVDPRFAVYLSSGNFEIKAGRVIVNDVARVAGVNDFSRLEAVTDATAATTTNFYVYDNTTTHPRGDTWNIPLADINIRGNLIISNPEVGTDSYKGACLDLYSSSGTKRNLCLHLGGSLTDFSALEPSIATPTTTGGFYIGPSAMNTTAYQDRPMLILNGNTNNQDIQGNVVNLRDYNDVPNMGTGILLPNVVVFKDDNTYPSVTMLSTIRVAGDFTIFAGNFTTNGQSLIVGDHARDEVNVMAIGDKDNATPDYNGTLNISPGSRLVVASTSAGNDGNRLNRGVIIRGRRGGYLNFIGTAGDPIEVARDSRIGGRIRIGVYHGGVISARYCTFSFPSRENTGTGDVEGYAITTGTPGTANNPNQDDFYNYSPPDAQYKEGGFKVMRGGILLQPAAGIDCFSNCAFSSADRNINLTIDTDRALDFGAAYNSAPAPRNITITNATINGNPLMNRGVISKLNANYDAGVTQDFSSIGYSSTLQQDYVIILESSSGTAGGTNGETNDDDAGTVAGGSAIDDRILWDNAPEAVWQGDVSNDWDNWQNWAVPSGACGSCTSNPDVGNGFDAANSGDNPDKLVPGKNGFTDVNVKIPSNTTRNAAMGFENFGGALAGLTYTINGSVEVNTGGVPGNQRRMILITGKILNVTVEGDMIVYEGGYLVLNQSILNLKSSFMVRDERRTTDDQESRVSNLFAGTSTINIIGEGTQAIQVRHNPVYNIVINKPSGLVILQGYNSNGTSRQNSGGNQVYTFRVKGNFQLDNGYIRVNSFTPVDIRGDYIQTGGIFEPLASQITIRGNYNATAGDYIAGDGVLQFYPLKNSSTTKFIRANGQTFNNIVIGDGDNIDITGSGSSGGNNPNVMQSGRQTYQMGYMLFRYEYTSNTPLYRKHRYLQIAGTADSTGTTASDDIFTYSLLTDLTTTGTITVRGNRTLEVRGVTLKAQDIDLNWRSRMNLLSSNTATGELQMSAGKTLTVNPNARLDMIGLVSRFVKITRAENVGRYGVEIDGKVSARYYIAEYMDAEGIELKSHADPISPGTIIYGGGGQGYSNDPTETFTSLYAGTGASITATVGGTELTSIEITNQGSGYTSLPAVTFSGGTPAASNGAMSVTPVIEGSPLTGITVTDGGSGYTSVPTVNIAGGGGSGAAATAVMSASNVISAINVTGVGSGYTTPPNVVISGAGSGAEAEANLDPSPLLTTTYTAFVNPGAGYTDGVYTNALNITGGLGIGAQGNFTVVGGVVTQVEITNGGSNYTHPIEIQLVGGGSPTTVAEVNTTNIEVVGTTVASVAVTEGGSGYTGTPTISFTGGGGGSGAAANATTATGGDRVVAVELTNAGTSYESTPTVSFSGGGGTGAAAVAETTGGRLTAINIGTNQPFETLPTIDITGGGGTGATADALGLGASVTGFTGLVGGSDYRTIPILSITDPTGTGASAVIKLTTDADPLTELGNVTEINILSGGEGYNSTPTITLVSANGDGTASTVVPTGDIVMSGTSPNMTVDAVNVPSPGYGSGYTTAPNIIITGGGSPGQVASARALLAPTSVASIVLEPERILPVASFSNGIITNTASNPGAAFTIDGGVSFYRDKANNNTDEDNLVGGQTPLAAKVLTTTHDYGAGFGVNAGPRVDTIYNVVFALNPNASNTYNVRRTGTDNNPENRIIFKDAIGAFSGEDYDYEEYTSSVAAGVPNTYLNPNGIIYDGSITPPLLPADSMVLWREPNVKRWDGGPTGAGTAWNVDANWRPDGVPEYYHDIIIDYSLMWVDYTTNPPTLQSPQLNIDMNHNYIIASGKSLTIDPLILPVGTGTSIREDIDITMQDNFRVGGTIAIGEDGEISGSANHSIDVGESWSNNGGFTANQTTVNFYKNTSRTIVNTLDSKVIGTDNLSGDRNAFYNVIFAEGVTDLSTDILVKGNLDIGTNGELSAGAGNRFIYLEGDWTNQGSFRPQNGTVYFRGNSLQRVRKIEPILTGASVKENFYNMVVNTTGASAALNSNNNVTLENKLEVANNMVFFNGRVLSDRDKELILGLGATVNGGYSTNVTANSFVQGPVGRLKNTTTAQTLIYPIGSEKNAGSGASITITGVDGDGVITGINIGDGGTGYSPGNRVFVNSLTGTEAEFTVSSVDASGAITGIDITGTTTGTDINGDPFTFTNNSGRGYTISDDVEVPKGQGTSVYVGGNTSALDLVDLTIASADTAMFVAEQIETGPTSVKILPDPDDINYVSETRHWTVRNLPYVQAGDISNASNPDMGQTNVALYFLAEEELLENPIDGMEYTGDNQLTELTNLTVLHDSTATHTGNTPGAGSVPSGIAYTDHSGSYHNERLQDGTAYASDRWIDVGPTGSGTAQVNTTASIRLLSTQTVTSLNDGTFVIGMYYSPLPLEVIELNATPIGQEVLLNWVTASESTSEKFIVERSFDGVNFEEIGVVSAQGAATSRSTTLAYEFTDIKPQIGINYYRLRQVEFSGNEELTKVVSATVTSEEQFVVYPNPNLRGNAMNVLVPSREGEQISLQLIDIQGRIVMIENVNSTGDAIEFMLNPNLAEGMYILNVQTETKNYQAKIILK